MFRSTAIKLLHKHGFKKVDTHLYLKEVDVNGKYETIHVSLYRFLGKCTRRMYDKGHCAPFLRSDIDFFIFFESSSDFEDIIKDRQG